ncbi:MAG: hypothetical protein ACE5EQ_06530 [Phycisphaerae bacterium]
MWPIENPFHPVSSRAVRLGIIAVALTTILQAQAPAHTILLSRGTTVVHQDRILSRIEINGKDFVHYYPLRPVTDGYAVSTLREAVLKHRQHLLNHFIVRNARGERLHGQCVDVEWNEPSETKINYTRLGEIQVIYVLEHPTGTPPRFLTFQQFFGGDHAPMPARLALSVMSANHSTARFIQLTNRGNVETLEFTWSERAVDKPIPASVSEKQLERPGQSCGPDRFKTVCADLHIDGTVVRCDIYIPIVLLETWLPLQRTNRDFIDANEMIDSRDRLRSFFTGRNRIRINDRRAEPSAVELSFLAPDARTMDEPQMERLGVWSARIGVRLLYETKVPVNHVELIWDLFNNFVFNATVTMGHGKSRREIMVTPNSPIVSLSRR